MDRQTGRQQPFHKTVRAELLHVRPSERSLRPGPSSSHCPAARSRRWRSVPGRTSARTGSPRARRVDVSPSSRRRSHVLFRTRRCRLRCHGRRREVGAGGPDVDPRLAAPAPATAESDEPAGCAMNVRHGRTTTADTSKATATNAKTTIGTIHRRRSPRPPIVTAFPSSVRGDVSTTPAANGASATVARIGGVAGARRCRFHRWRCVTRPPSAPERIRHLFHGGEPLDRIASKHAAEPRPLRAEVGWVLGGANSPA